jgi:hypothetical protein
MPAAARVRPASASSPYAAALRTPTEAPTNDFTPCRMPPILSPPALAPQTPTKQAALRLRGGRRTPLVRYRSLASCTPSRRSGMRARPHHNPTSHLETFGRSPLETFQSRLTPDSQQQSAARYWPVRAADITRRLVACSAPAWPGRARPGIPRQKTGVPASLAGSAAAGFDAPAIRPGIRPRQRLIGPCRRSSEAGRERIRCYGNTPHPRPRSRRARKVRGLASRRFTAHCHVMPSATPKSMTAPPGAQPGKCLARESNPAAPWCFRKQRQARTPAAAAAKNGHLRGPRRSPARQEKN